MFEPGKEPALQSFASDYRGRNLERLDGLAGTQPYSSRGPWLSTADSALLEKVAQTGRLGRFERSGNEESIAVLADAGIVDAKGRLTDQGGMVTRPLSQGVAALNITGTYLGRTTNFRAWLDTNDAMVLAGPSHHLMTSAADEAADYADGRQLDYMSINDLYTAMAAWVGLSPAWSIPVLPAMVDLQEMDRRWAAVTDPPLQADEALMQMWREPWFVWQLAAVPGSGQPVTYINAGAAGHYRTGVLEGAGLLEATLSSNVYRHLGDIVEAAVFNRPPRFD
ncbi:hypothetical protein B0G38_000087 [Arthrobacter sp. VKM Ac-2550]|nr:hypothetical protein [Arthrobacter sp. VKM Ac-2550]